MAKSKRKKRVKFKVKNIIILLVIFLFICLMGYCFLMMPIENIYINGNKILDDDTIMEIIDIDEYPSFILTNKYNMKKKLKSNKYINEVTVKKRIGNIFEIDILEYKVIVSNKDGMVMLSNGDILENDYNIYDLPLLINDINDVEVYKLFCIKMEKLDSDILRQISEIEYSPVSVDNERFLFYMNDGNLVHVTLTKLDKLNKYNKIKDKLEGKIGTIYLDSGDYVELKK